MDNWQLFDIEQNLYYEFMNFFIINTLCKNWKLN